MLGVTMTTVSFGNCDAHAVGIMYVVLQLKAGDDVWIRIHENVNNGNVRIHGGKWSRFVWAI